MRPVLIIQGILWIIAGISLLTISSIGSTTIVFMIGLGAAFIGWGYSIGRGTFLSNPHLADGSFSLNEEPNSNEIKFYKL